MPEALINLLVQPGAKKNEVVGEMDGAIKIKVAAPPVEGKANRELIAFLAKKLFVKKSDVTIDKGQSSRRKVVRIEGIETNEARRAILDIKD